MHLLIVTGRQARPKRAALAEFNRRLRHGGWRATEIALDDFLKDPAAHVRDCDDLAVAGGDGTVNACLAVSGAVPLLVVPLGTGNDLARSLNIRTANDAARLIRCGHRKAIDLGRVRHAGGEERFANGIGIGLDGLVSRAHARGAPYWLAAARAALAPPRFRATLTVDQRPPRELEFLSLVAANGAYFGGGFKLAPAALLDDGHLDLVSIAPVGRKKYLSSLWSARRGRHVQDAAVATATFRRLVVEASAPLPWHLDGEPRESQRLEIEVLPAARRFYVQLY